MRSAVVIQRFALLRAERRFFAGVFLCAGVVHVMSEAIEQWEHSSMSHDVEYPLPYLLVNSSLTRTRNRFSTGDHRLLHDSVP